MAIVMTPQRVRAARVLAITADAVQLGLLPLFVGGWVSPVNDALDVCVGLVMIWLLGWHWVFLPAFASELIPFWDLVPSWTAAVLIATGGLATSVEPGAGAPKPPPVLDVPPDTRKP